jgi:flagellar basal body P-ring formation protein FlgA
MNRLRVFIFFIILTGFLSSPFGSSGKAVESGQKKSGDEPKYQIIREAKYRELFLSHMQRLTGKKREDLAVSSLRIFGDGPVPPGKLSFQLSQNEQGKLGGDTSLNVVVRVDGRVQKRVRLSGWVDIFEPVVCVSRDIKKREILQQEDLYLSRKNISHLPSNVLTDMDEAVGLMIKHQVVADTPLKTWMLERAPILERGDMVTILGESEGLRVTVPGKIMEKGYKGELIRVQNTMSRKQIYARVIDEATVQVEF